MHFFVIRANMTQHVIIIRRDLRILSLGWYYNEREAWGKKSCLIRYANRFIMQQILNHFKSTQSIKKDTLHFKSNSG